MKRYPKHSGFTLIELLVTLSILAILVMVAAPSMESSRKTSAVREHLREFQSALAFARGEALTRSRYVTMCPRAADSEACVDSNNFSNGWLIFVEDESGNGVYDSSSEELIRLYEHHGSNTARVLNPLPSSVPVNSLTWTYRGLSKDEQRSLIIICENTNDVNYARGLMVASSGRAVLTQNKENSLIHESAFEDDTGTVVSEELTCP